jgi:hypothetical protein
MTVYPELLTVGSITTNQVYVSYTFHKVFRLCMAFFTKNIYTLNFAANYPLHGPMLQLQKVSPVLPLLMSTYKHYARH